jgi:osmotically inducible lipoprotein OsmB
MQKFIAISLASGTLIALSGCGTPQQTVGVTTGAVGGALVGGPVGAVVGGTVGGVATAPGMPLGAHHHCHYRDSRGHLHSRAC